MKDTLEENIPRMERELAEMREKLERQKRNWPEKLEAGMIFRHKNGDHYMTRLLNDSVAALDLVALDNGAGMHWNYGLLFNGAERDFTYIGLAEYVLRIEA